MLEDPLGYYVLCVGFGIISSVPLYFFFWWKRE